MNMNRISAAFFATFVVLLALFACGTKEPPQNTIKPETVVPSTEKNSKDKKITTVLITKAAVPISTKTSTASMINQPTRPGTGGDLPFAYDHRMANLHGNFITPEIAEDVDAWIAELSEERSMDMSLGSFYDFVHIFAIKEDFFREQNAKILEPYSEEDIHDLFYLTRQEFINKYASPYMLVIGEKLYFLGHLVDLDEHFAAARSSKVNKIAFLRIQPSRCKLYTVASNRTNNIIRGVLRNDIVEAVR